MKYDLLVIGSGPGGYVAAIRASQLGMKTAVVERAELGGICLNWGCIPTKALLKSAQVFNYLKHADDYGIEIEGNVKPNFEKVVERSRNVAAGMSKGIQYLFGKNKIDVINGHGKLIATGKVQITNQEGETITVEAKNIILATGARSKELPGLKQDGEKIIGYREAMTLKKQPESMIVVGSGAIGTEFAYFYNSIGTQVTIVEYLPNLVPLEDEDVSKQLERSFKKSKIKVLTNTAVKEAKVVGDKVEVLVEGKKGEETIEADVVLSAVGVATNIANIGLEELGIKTDRDKIVVDDYYKTNIDGIYAIGDIVHGPALAHVASAEGICCVEKIAGIDVEPIDYNNIPSAVYSVPEIASVGITEKQAIDAGYEIKVGKFPFTASGKAAAAGSKDGFIKLIFDANLGELLGAHFIGDNVTEMIAEMVVAKKLEATAHEIIKSIHPHPSLSEAIMEAAAAAYDEVIHI